MKQIIKNISLAFAVSCLSLGVFAQCASQDFTIKGTIPGVKNGTQVKLKSQESGKYIETECLTQGSSFTLKGKVNGTLLVQLCIDDKPKASYTENDYARDRGGKLMLEAGNYTVSAACFDSLALNYDLETVPMVHEMNMKVVGGKAQQQYQEWATATFEARKNLDILDFQLRNAKFRSRKEGGPDSAAVNRLEPLVDKATQNLDALNAQFVKAHPDYAISLLLENQQLAKPFARTVAEYDQLVSTFANNYDQVRYAAFKDYVAQMKKYPKGASYRELALETVDGKATNLKNVIVAGKYNFIDFWASWCGPCRAAIPSVKKLYAKLGDRLNVISISVDKRKEDWQGALKEENMPWHQYLVPVPAMKALKEAYLIQYVPSLVVIDPEGKIQLFTGDPAEAHRYLEEKLN